MQERTAKGRQERRRAETRAALLGAARRLFGAQGYAGAGTPEIVAAAGVTRGALYHHFADKRDLFRAVVEAEHVALAAAIEAAAEQGGPGPVKALLAGGDGFLEAMQDPVRRRILLVDAPAVLGRAELDAIDARHGLRMLAAGLETAMAEGAIRDLPMPALAHLVNALFDRAALAPADATKAHRKALRALIRGLRV